MNKKHNAPKIHTPIFLGTGLIALDMVTNGAPSEPPRFWAGGSCGNVVTILAHLGWHSYPIARLGNDKAAKIIAEDMRKHNVDFRYVSYDRRVHTPIVLQRILSSADGNPTHRFYWVCPNCGTWLPRYRPILLRDARVLDEVLPEIGCFYFDRVSAAALYLAEKAREQGALVIFEPTSIKKDKQFEKAISVCDVLKYSNERAKNFARSIYESTAQIVIETLGSEGLRYRLRRNGNCGKWKFLSAFHVANLKDAAGAGDWCTAGMIDMLTKKRRISKKSFSDKKLVEALRYGQALSALNCAFEGARGAMYGLNKKQFAKEVKAILERKEAITSIVNGMSLKAQKTVKCVCPICQKTQKEARKK